MAGFLGDTVSSRALRATPGSQLCFQPDTLTSLAVRREDTPVRGNTHWAWSREGGWEALSLVPRPIDGKVQAETACLENEIVQLASTTSHELLKNPAPTNYRQPSEDQTAQKKDYNTALLELLYKLCTETKKSPSQVLEVQWEEHLTWGQITNSNPASINW